jgi:LuxR family maltose regulon positive regulatory protein
MAAGLSNREIADELFLSVNTIKVYASRLYAKLGVHRRGEAAAAARELGLI